MQFRSIMLVLVLLPGKALVLGDDGGQPPKTEQRLPALDPSVYPEGTTSEAEYAAWLDEQHRALARAVDAGSIGGDGRGLARQANWILAYHCEPPLTRMLLGIAEPADAEALCSRLDAASELLRKAQDQSLGGADRDRLECLADMARSLRQFCSSRRGQAQTAELEDAAADLSIWLDDDSAEVRESARLIQSLLNVELGRFEQCMPVLPKATAPIDSSDVAGAIFARAMRCRIQARMGHHISALALLLKMEEKCSDWLSSDDKTVAAEATLAWFRLQIARDYPPELGKLAREMLDASISEAHTMVFEDEAPGLLRLHPAVPILFDTAEAPPLPGDAPDKAPEAAHPVKDAPD